MPVAYDHADSDRSGRSSSRIASTWRGNIWVLNRMRTETAMWT